jgi:uncharacterized protein
MKILHITDLHGNRWKYEASLNLAKLLEVSIIVNSGDLYPKDRELLKNGDLFNQDIFITGFLDRFLMECNKNNICYLLIPGNDDLLRFDRILNEVVSKYPNIYNVDQKIVSLDGYDFIGMSCVSDYPFQLKDRCRKDSKNFVFEKQFGPGLLSTGKHRTWSIIQDWIDYSSSILTMEEELNILPKPENPRRAIYIIHDPPDGLGLDEVNHSRRVGSKAVRKFLEKNQPLLSLHGHVHESPRVSGVWKAEIGETLAIQPGSERFLPYVVIDLVGETVKAELFNIEKGEAKSLRAVK